ncbi:MAG: insulinase family protein [Ignavibacteriae bacterium]|nr:insulinase family protein [Ignavibacteriota bacterium]
MSFEFNLDRSKPPVVAKSKDVKFPAYFEAKLANGIKVFVIEDDKIPLVTAKFVMKTGTYDELAFGEDKSGLASITSDLLVKGTEGMNAVKVAETVDYFGASLNSGCEYDATYLALTSLKKYFTDLFGLASRLLMNPSFLEEEIEREKQQITNSLLSYLDEGSFLSERAYKINVYKNSPYKLNIEGKISSVENIRQEYIKEFFGKYFNPQNLVIAIVGDIKKNEALALVNSKFGNWNPGKHSTGAAYTDILGEKTKIIAVEKKGAVQSEILMGHLGVNRNTPDFIPVMVMNTLLGGFFTSRINKNLREVNGYTYGARSYFNFRKFSGDFCIETNVENSLTYNAVNEIIKELNILRNEKITADELDSVKNYLSGSFPLQLETPNAIANKILNLELYGIGKDFYESYITRINEVSIDDVKRVSQEYIHPDKLVISIAGNTGIIKSSMEQIAEVEVIKNINEL